MYEFVLLGRSATIRTRHQREVPASEAALKIYRYDKNHAQQVLATPTLPLRDGVGVYEWPSTGLERDEMSCEVFWEVRIEGKMAGKGEVIVYRDRIEVLVVDAKDGTTPLPRAISRLTATGDAGWAKQTRFVGALDVTADQRSALDGTLDFPGLVYGRHEIAFRPPFFLREWKTEGEYTATGPRRKAVVEKRYSACIVSPRPESPGPRRQWVNLDPAGAGDGKQREEKGSLVTVRVRVKEEDGGGLAGDKIWVRAVYPEGNSPRTGDPRPTFAGDPVRPGQSYLKEYTLGADGAVIDVPVELGQAGGDRVTILVASHAGVSEDSHDEKLVIENWRRLRLQHVSANGAMAQRIPDEVQALTKTAFEQAFIEVDIPSVPLRLDAPSGLGCREVTGDIAEGMKLPGDARNVLFTFESAGVGNDVAKKFEAAYDGSPSCPAYPPTLFVVLGQSQFTRATTQTFSVKVKGRNKVRLTANGGFFILRDWTGRDTIMTLADGSASHWKANGQPVAVTREYLTIADEHRAVDFAIPSTVPERPGFGSRTENPVELRVQLFSSVAGSSSGRWCCFWFKRAMDPERAAYALIHEMGHCLGHVVVEPGAHGLAPDARNNLAYQYSGSHCSTGVSGLDRTNTTETTYVTETGANGRSRYVPKETVKFWHASINWEDQVNAGRQGSCVMFSPVGAKTKYAAQPTFCAPCLGYLKAADLRRTPPP